MDKVIGQTDVILSRRNALESNFNRQFTKILLDEANTEVAMTPGFRFDAVMAPVGEPIENDAVADGSVTVGDVYRLFPVSYNLATGTTSGANLKSILSP